ncbi:hypothetical protein [Roseomonas sp. BN140053]|uniref:hypothetical protein n=1 Tax=Roseomonas sp. BN140053 TaxID=3391898 RepID=UPI0039ED5D0A
MIRWQTIDTVPKFSPDPVWLFDDGEGVVLGYTRFVATEAGPQPGQVAGYDTWVTAEDPPREVRPSHWSPHTPGEPVPEEPDVW